MRAWLAGDPPQDASSSPVEKDPFLAPGEYAHRFRRVRTDPRKAEELSGPRDRAAEIPNQGLSQLLDEPRARRETKMPDTPQNLPVTRACKMRR